MPPSAADNSVEVEKGWIVKADTIEELAELIGKDPENLRAEVDHFNEMVEAGADVLVAGSAIYGAPDPAQAIRALRGE